MLIIYIPLCFYLYDNFCSKCGQRIRHLHSTMLLLIRISIFPHIQCASFTFHYASTYTALMFQAGYTNRIYIPLCFYLYSKTGEKYIYIRKFTFHYASTYTLSIVKSFAYPFIYIPLCFYLYAKVQGSSIKYA